MGLGLFWGGFFLSFPPLGEGSVISNPFSSAGTHCPCWAESRVCPARGLSAHSALHRLGCPVPGINQCSTSMEQVLQPQSLSRACISPGAGQGAGSCSTLWDHVRGHGTSSYGGQWGDRASVALASSLEVTAGQQAGKGSRLCPGLQGSARHHSGV